MSAIIRNPSNVVTAGPIGFNTSSGDITFTTAAGTIVTIPATGTPAIGVVGNVNVTGSFTVNGVPVEKGTFITSEVPAGLINSANTIFTLAHPTPEVGSAQVFLNGLLQNSGAGNDYTISTNTITFATAPVTGSTLLVSYRF